MSHILNPIKQIVAGAVNVEVQPEKYGKYPVIVTDKSQSFTSGWSLTYQAQKSKFEEKLVDFRGRFSQLVVTNASQLISDIEVAYGRFRSGDSVRQFGNTTTATYESEKVWFTLTQRTKGVNVVMTVTDPASPFHMLQLSIFVMNEANGRHPIVGYDHCLNVQANTWTDRQDNAVLAPAKRRVIPVNQEDSNSPALAKVQGALTPNGLIAIDAANTDIDYIQNYTNERRLIAGLYEVAIMEHAFSIAIQNLPASTTTNFAGQTFGGQQQAFGQQPQQPSFGGQQPTFGAQQQQPAFGQQPQQPAFGGQPQQFGTPQQPAFGAQPQQQFGSPQQPVAAFGQQPQQPAGANTGDMPTW